jgi:sirohydrochlorin cobaltochelatase
MDILYIGFGDLSNLVRETSKRFPGANVSYARSVAAGLNNVESNDVIVQPAYLLPGIEYDKMRAEIKALDKSVLIGNSLLYDDEATQKLATILTAEYQGKSVLYVGHGTAHAVRQVYSALSLSLQKHSAYVAVLDGEPNFETVSSQITESGLRSLTLVPLMMITGKHVKEEIIGDSSESCRGKLERKGFEIDAVNKGLLEYPAVREMIFSSIEHTINGGNVCEM